MTGRPSVYTQEIADEICRRLIEGESLRAICEDDHLPSKTTVLVWAHGNEAFRDQYTRARELSGESDADDVAHVARLAMRGQLDAAAANAAINGLKWSAGKRQPKKYGERVQQEISGPDGGPIQSQARMDVAGLTDEQLRVLASIKLPAEG